MGDTPRLEGCAKCSQLGARDVPTRPLNDPGCPRVLRGVYTDPVERKTARQLYEGKRDRECFLHEVNSKPAPFEKQKTKGCGTQNHPTALRLCHPKRGTQIRCRALRLGHLSFQFIVGLEGSGVTVQGHWHGKPQYLSEKSYGDILTAIPGSINFIPSGPGYLAGISNFKKRTATPKKSGSRAPALQIRRKISVPLGTKLSRMRTLFTVQRSFRCP